MCTDCHIDPDRPGDHVHLAFGTWYGERLRMLARLVVMKHAAGEACHGEAHARMVSGLRVILSTCQKLCGSWLEKCCHQAGNISSGQWHERQHTHNPVTGRVRNAFAVLRDGVHEWRGTLVAT